MGSRLDGGVRTKKTELISGVLSSRSVEPNSLESVREVVRSLSADEALSLLSSLQLFWEESSRIKEHQGTASLIATDLRDVIFSNNGKASAAVVEQCVDLIVSKIHDKSEINTQDFEYCIYLMEPIIAKLGSEMTRKIKTDILKLIRKTPKDTFRFRQVFWLSTFVSAMAFVYLFQKYCIFRKDTGISAQYYTEVSQLPILDAREKLALPAEAFDPQNSHLSKSLWSTACEAINEIWLDASKYKADGVFTTDDVQVLRGAILCLVDENSPEFTNTLAEYWRKLAVAPNPKVKTMASQSIAAAIANAVADRPSIETIVAMREVKPEIRHAGMKKKFDRLLRKAERNLSSQPDFILRLPPDYPISKKMRTTVKLSMEALFLREGFFSLESWEMHFRSIPEIWALAKGLIWLVQSPDGARSSVIPREVDGELEWSDAHQQPVQMTEGVKIRLWHPVIACDADREDWRNAIVESGLKQPFAQAYREFYQLSEEELSSGKCALFSESRVGVRHVLGVSNAVG